MRIEFADEQRRGKVVAGVDTHSATRWLCVLSEYGGVKLSMEFPANAEGYDLLAREIGDPAGCLAVGVEGTASYGAGLARRLQELGFAVYEVLRPKREKRRRGEDKNDAADAGDAPAESALAALAESWTTANEKADAVKAEMSEIIEANCPSLLAIFGCSTVCAAKLAVVAGDNPERIGGEAAFAALCGTSPVQASSGETDRHRLNRGGNRDANAALHQIVLVRVQRGPETRAYMEKRCSRGAGAKRESKKEAMRCLQRYVVREVYHALRNPFEASSAPEAAELRAARKKARLTQADAAAAIGCSVSAIS